MRNVLGSIEKEVQFVKQHIRLCNSQHRMCVCGTLLTAQILR